MIPKRRKAPKSNIRPEPQIRCPGHLAWVRGHECSVFGHPITPAHMPCGGRIEAAHVRIGTDGGTAVKPGDNWAIPLCSDHHFEQHRLGERSFEAKYSVKMKAISEALWLKSPHGIKWRAARSPAVNHQDAKATERR